jgi:hypothetical protein
MPSPLAYASFADYAIDYADIISDTPPFRYCFHAFSFVPHASFRAFAAAAMPLPLSRLPPFQALPPQLFVFAPLVFCRRLISVFRPLHCFQLMLSLILITVADCGH